MSWSAATSAIRPKIRYGSQARKVSGTAALNRFTIDRNGRPVEYGRSAARGDLYRYWVKLKAISSS